MQFTKLFNSILDSTIWQEPAATKICWITMLAMCDRSGDIFASIPGLASRAGISVAEAETAMACFLSPDKYSRTKDHEGRRAAEIDGGWTLLNHGKYRALLSSEERREYNRRKQAEFRERNKGLSKNVNDSQSQSSMSAHTEAEAEAEAEAEKTKPNTPPLPPKVEPKPLCTMEQAKSQAPTSGLTEQEAEYWWHSRNSAGWTKATANGGHPRKITSWQSDMAASVEWVREHAKKNGTEKPKWKPNL